MITGDNNPGNTNTNELNISNPSWKLIAVLIIVILVLIILMVIGYCLHVRKIEKLQKQFSKDINPEELNMIMQYRTLNEHDKTVMQSTLKAFTENNEHRKE